MKNQSRRQFLKHLSAAALTAGAMTMPFISYGRSFRRKEKLGIALVGLGYYSTKVLMPAFSFTEACYLAGLVTGTPEKERIYGEQFNIPKKNIYNYENFDEIASNDDIDVVYVVLPNSMHKEYTIRAAQAGKHVICEKPMALNARECREMIAACNSAGVSLSIGYRLHYEPYTQYIQQLAREKKYGDIIYVTASAGFRMSRPTEHWKIKPAYGGGAMMDMGVYSLQGARYATGLEPISVSAQQFNPDPAHISEVDETTTFQLEFPNGIVANCTTTFSTNTNFLKIYAAKGQYGLEPFSGYSGLHGFSPGGPFDFPKMNQQAAQMDGMCRAIMEGKPSLTPGEEGLRDMVIVDAIKKSVRKGGKKVML